MRDQMLIEPRVYEESEKAFRHAEERGIVLGPRRVVKARIKCNQSRDDGSLCEYERVIEVRSIDVETKIVAVLRTHVKQNHPLLDAAAVADRRWTSLRDIGS